MVEELLTLAELLVAEGPQAALAAADPRAAAEAAAARAELLSEQGHDPNAVEATVQKIHRRESVPTTAEMPTLD